MSDISITAASVAISTGTSEAGTAGEALTAGQVVYQAAATGRWWKAQCDGTEAEAAAKGIALNSAPAAGQPITVQTSGTITAGGTLVEGEIYIVSATAGGLAPEADIITTGNYVSIVGVAQTAALLKLSFNASGGQVPA